MKSKCTIPTGSGHLDGSAKCKDPTDNVIMLIEKEVRRNDDMRNLEIVHQKEITALHIDYLKEAAERETKRIDALRAVDVQAVSIASDKAAQAAAVLNTQLVASADALKVQVASQATSQEIRFQQMESKIIDRVTKLEQQKYEDVGRLGISSKLPDRLSFVEDVLLRQEGAKQNSDTSKKDNEMSTNKLLGIIGATAAITGTILAIAAFII